MSNAHYFKRGLIFLIWGCFVLPCFANYNQIETEIIIDATVIAQPNCLNSSGGAINLNVTGGSGEYIFNWNNPASNIQNPENLPIGIYGVTVTDSEGATAATFVEILGDFDAPSTNILPTDILTCQSPTILLHAFNSSFGNQFVHQWTTPDGNIVEGENTLHPTVNQGGIYELLITNLDNGCTAAASTFVESLNPVFIDIQTPEILTCYTPEITLDASESSLGNNLIYEWTTNDGNIVSGANTLTPVVDESGNYQLIINDLQNGCSSSKTVTVEEDFYIGTLEIMPANALNCLQNEVEIEAQFFNNNRPFSIEWSTQNGGLIANENTLFPTVNQEGVYEITVTDLVSGCTANESVEILKNDDIPDLTILPFNAINCTESTVILEVMPLQNGDFSYTFSDSEGQVLNADNSTMIEVGQSGEYVVSVLDLLNGCSSEATVFVEDNSFLPALTITQNGELNCENSSVSLEIDTNLDANFSIEWGSNDANLGTNDGLETVMIQNAGIYWATLTDLQTGCYVTDSVTVLGNYSTPQISVETPQVLTCFENEIELTGIVDDPNLILNWTTANGNIIGDSEAISAMIDAAGTYYFSAQNPQTGCFSVEIVQVVANTEIPEINVDDDTELNCNEPKYILHGEVGWHDYPIDYQWFTSDGTFMLNQNTLQPIINGPGVYTFVVTNLENGCTVSDEVVVTQNDDFPEVEVVPFDTLTCANEIAVLNGENSEVNPDFLYEWTTETGVFLSNEMNAQTGETGIYIFTVTNELTECWTQKTVEIFADFATPEILSLTADTLTCWQEIAHIFTQVSGENLLFEWTTLDGYFNGATNVQNPNVERAGMYELTVFNENNGCWTKDSIAIIEDRVVPQIDLAAVDTLHCEETEMEISAWISEAENYSISWLEDGVILPQANTPHLTVTETGNFTLQVTNEANGCLAFDSISVYKLNDITVDFEITQPNCHQEFGQVIFTENDDPTVLFSIDGGQNFYSQNSFENLASGDYQLRAQNADGCEFSETISIDTFVELQLAMKHELFLELGQSIEIQVITNFLEEEIESIIWTNASTLSCDDCLNPIASPLQSTVYKVAIRTKNGCEIQGEIAVKIIPQTEQEILVIAPNVFSPNGDGENDIFYLQGDENGIERVLNFQIFNRWGDQVFVQQNFQINEELNGWDGTFKGQKMKNGVFVWWAEVLLLDGRKKVLKGDVILLR